MGENHEKVFVIGGFFTKEHNQFAPYEGNEELLGTYGDPAYKWEPKPGDLVAVSDDKKQWFAQVFIAQEQGRYEGDFETSDAQDLSQPAYWEFCEPLRKHFNVPEVE